MGTHGACWVILGDGEIVSYEGAARRIPAGCRVLCADGGYRHCRMLGLTPELLVGDFDSFSGDFPPGVPRAAHNAEKDYTDLTLSIEEALARGCASLLLAGVLGGRLDHTLANLQCMVDCARRGIPARATDGCTDVYALHAGERPASLRLQPRADAYFSVFAHSPLCEGTTITGAKYPLREYPLQSTVPRAVSNEFCGGPVEISIRAGDAIVVVTPKA